MPTNAPPTKTVTMYQGDTFVEQVTFYNGDGSTKDVSAFTWLAPQLRDYPDGNLLATLDVDPTNAAGGAIVYSLPASENQFDVVAGTFDVRFTDGSGDVTTAMVFIVQMEAQVTVV